MIKAVKAGFTYEGSEKPALEEINLTIPNGTIFGIAGSAGSGKSTLAMCLNGAIPHCIDGEFTGNISLDGRDTLKTSLEELCSIVGSVFQDVESQVVSSVVEDEIVFGMENLGFSRQDMENRVVESLAAVEISNLRYSDIGCLSGGQKQKVAIASALALRPKLLIMDEPTSELDPKSSIELFDVLRKLNQEKGITIIVIEQKLDLLVQYCDRIALMDKGSILVEGSNREILSKMEMLEEIGLQIPSFAKIVAGMFRKGNINFDFPVSIREAAVLLQQQILMEEGSTDCDTTVINETEITKPEITKQMKVDDRKEKKEICAINIQDLTYTVSTGKKVLDSISFSVKEGEFVAIVGHNGAGKSSLIQHFNGLIQPDLGKVQVVGLDPHTTKTSKMAQHVGFLFQNPDHQIFNQTVKEEIMFGLKNSGLTIEKIDERVKQAVVRVGLEHRLEEYPFRLSRGYRQRLAFASVLAMDPEILILDEPTTGQDYKESRQIMEIVADKNREGKTVVMITHDMDLVYKYAKRVIVLEDGKLIADGAVENIMTDTKILERTGLLPPGIVQLQQSLIDRKIPIFGKNEEEIQRQILKKVGVA
ncbi:MAG: ATP-binding cassette domain-containing protein [Peptococcaceae bacterium]|nr:ATP-binding cassette domain-containing protein [Peptococcaceae bacterium]